MSYDSQETPSQHPIPTFELTNDINFDIAKDLVNFKYPSTFEPVEVKGIRVRKHMECIYHSNSMPSMFKHVKACNPIQKEFKHWVSMSKICKNIFRNTIVLK